MTDRTPPDRDPIRTDRPSAQRRRRRVLGTLTALTLLVAAPLGAGAMSGEAPIWHAEKRGSADWREARFVVADPTCAYETMVDPVKMAAAFEHLEAVVVHSSGGGRQEVTFTERFFLVGLVESRYTRQFDGKSELSWQLISGRQKRHDGTWLVRVDAEGVVHVTFENVIEAKSVLHRGLLNRIQRRTMSDIVEQVTATCRSQHS